MESRRSVLIVDDDPSHLRVSGWIVESAGYEPVNLLVRYTGLELEGVSVDLVLLDYHLAGSFSAVDAAKLLRAAMPGVPIVLLTDELQMPADVAPMVDGFVRKGDPGKLVMTLQKFLHN